MVLIFALVVVVIIMCIIALVLSMAHEYHPPE